ncbi:MAG TPA: oxaloacetate decarboxylase [Solirubrobacterales bacterium]
MTQTNTPAQRTSFRELLAEPGITQVMGAHDGLLARIAARAGFKALYHGSFAVASTHGVPDIALVGLGETAAGVRRVTGAVDIPVIADADTGYGNEAAVYNTVRVLERAGASAIQIEDQVFPKRCGHMPGKEVIDRDLMLSKIRTACDARRDPETVIIARTDSLQGHGVDEALSRCNDFAEAGADVVFADAPETEDDLRTVAAAAAPSMANMTETGKTPLLPAQQLEELGFAVVIYPSNQIWTIAGAFERLCRAVIDSGGTESVRAEMLPFAEVNEILGLETYQELES